jgi:hypothetical protein
MSLSRAISIGSLVGGFFTFLVGLVHLFHWALPHKLCDDDVSDCVGPLLNWDGDEFFTVDDNNPKFRGVFGVGPTVVATVWSPILLGLYTVLAHSHETSRILQNWATLCVWHGFLGVFGNFPFAGGAGIIVGFFNIVISGLCLLAHFFVRGEVVNMDVLSGRGQFSITLSNVNTLVKITDVLSIVSVLLTFIVCGAFHIAANEFHKWCRGDDCVGPWLTFPDDFFETVNLSGWGSLFTLAPDRFGDVWGAAALSFFTLLVPSSSWFNLMIWHLILALFGSFGYAGNIGILIGFLHSVVAFFAALVALAAAPPSESGVRYVLLR